MQACRERVRQIFGDVIMTDRRGSRFKDSMQAFRSRYNHDKMLCTPKAQIHSLYVPRARKTCPVSRNFNTCTNAFIVVTNAFIVYTFPVPNFNFDLFSILFLENRPSLFGLSQSTTGKLRQCFGADALRATGREK